MASDGNDNGADSFSSTGAGGARKKRAASSAARVLPSRRGNATHHLSEAKADDRLKLRLQFFVLQAAGYAAAAAVAVPLQSGKTARKARMVAGPVPLLHERPISKVDTLFRHIVLRT